MRLRSDFRAPVTIMNRLHRESGEERAEPIPFQQYQRCHGHVQKAGGAHEFNPFFKNWLQ